MRKKALTFTWISRFGVPESITSDHGPKFTSNLWFQLCEMLNISHKQTTAYHRSRTVQLKGCTAASRTSFAHAPPRRHGPRSYLLCSSDSRAQLREDTGLSPAEAVFGAQIVLPNEFLQNDELSVDPIVKKFSKTLHVSAPSLPRHNSSTELPSELPAKLLSAPLVWVRGGGLVPPLQPLYDGPYAVLRRGPRSFTIRVRSWDEVVAVSRLKACTAADATPGSPRRRGRPQGSPPGGPAATKRVSFSDPLVSSPSPPAPPRDGPRTVLLPGEEIFASPGPAALHKCHRRGTRPVNGHRLGG